MKKLFIFAAVGLFAACGSGSGSSTTDSTTVVKSDTVTNVMHDSTNMTTDSTKMMPDSTRK